MDIELYFGQYVRVELDTGNVHYGVLEEVKDGDVTDYSTSVALSKTAVPF